MKRDDFSKEKEVLDSYQHLYVERDLLVQKQKNIRQRHYTNISQTRKNIGKGIHAELSQKIVNGCKTNKGINSCKTINTSQKKMKFLDNSESNTYLTSVSLPPLTTKVPKPPNIQNQEQISDRKISSHKNKGTTNNYLFISDNKGNQHQWLIVNFAQFFIRTIDKAHKESIECIAYDKSNFKLYTTDIFGNMKAWDIETGTLHKDYRKIHYGAIYALEITSTKLFTGDRYGNLKSWNLSKEKLDKNFGRVTNYSITCIAITEDNRYLFVSDINGSIKQIDLKRRLVMKQYLKLHEAKITSMATSGNYLLSGDQNGVWHQLDINIMKSLYEDNSSEYGILAMGSIGGYFVSGHEFGGLKLWRVKSGQKGEFFGVMDGERHKQDVIGLGFVKGGQWFVGLDKNKDVKIWNLDSKKLMSSYKEVCEFDVKFICVC